MMFLYRDEVYNAESPDKGAAEVIVAKHRSGPIGTKRLVFLGQYTRFDNAARVSDPVTDADVAAYLRRIGLEAEPPSVEALQRLHRAQVEHVPYESAWIHLGEQWDIDPLASMRRVAHEGRGGYCYHLNGALSLLLAARSGTGSPGTSAVSTVRRARTPQRSPTTSSSSCPTCRPTPIPAAGGTSTPGSAMRCTSPCRCFPPPTCSLR